MWSEAIWNKHHYNQTQYTSHIQRFRYIYLAYGGIQLPPVYDLPDDMLFSYPLTYCKAGLVYNMIYDYLGEEKFLEILREIMGRYAFSSLTTDEFLNVVKELDTESQMDWDVFFEQWLKKPGHPQFDLQFNISQNSSEKYNLDISLKQTQKFIGVPEVFKSPITFIAEDTLNLISHEFRAFINNAEENFDFELDFIPNKVTISEHSIISETVNNVINSVDSKAEIITGLYPNPVSSGNDFKLSINTDIKEIYSGYTINNALELNISTAGLTAGIYNIKIFNSKISSNLNLILK